ncbi:hypothetical protein O181_047154 [Austropuccinia psidii MF-1]|uniref:D-aminoacyl-tRNA deacylase n=1 Tax=Austropuccinia psidii MF-1 TaxID=1389203 RepID=A0A9Q3DQA2_9BASI|nr:hypothetical protein [Austropuccinia psidii MF-1]
MRAVIQRVLSAQVIVNETEISKIGKGLCVLVGIGKDDNLNDLNYTISKILNLKLFSSPLVTTTATTKDDNNTNPTKNNGEQKFEAKEKNWSQSVKDIQGGILCVSQFTLMANVKKGFKPDFHNAMKSENSKELYNEFLKKLRENYREDLVNDGQFGAMMEVQLINQGPVTIIIDSKDKGH